MFFSVDRLYRYTWHSINFYLQSKFISISILYITCRAFGRTDCEVVPSQNDTQQSRYMFSPRPDLFSPITRKFKAFFTAKKSISPVPSHISIDITCNKYINNNCMAIVFFDVSSFLRDPVRL